MVRFGNDFASVGCMLLTRFRASRSVCSRGERGKLERAVMSLSVKSMASWSYSDCSATLSQYSLVPIERPVRRDKGRERRRRGEEGKGKGKGGGQTLATPRFSMAGILCPVVLVYDINGARLKKCSICSFQLTHL